MEYPKISLKAARVNAELTQIEAVKLLKINVSTLQSYESGERIPPWNVVRKMSEIYGIHTDYLFLRQNTA